MHWEREDFVGQGVRGGIRRRRSRGVDDEGCAGWDDECGVDVDTDWAGAARDARALAGVRAAGAGGGAVRGDATVAFGAE